MTTEEQKKGLRRLKALLTRRARYVPVPKFYGCEGGPFNGGGIFLQTSATGVLTVGDFHGRYNQVSDRGYYHTVSSGPTVVWEDYS